MTAPTCLMLSWLLGSPSTGTAVARDQAADMDPILSRSLLALALGVALILLSIVLAPPA